MLCNMTVYLSPVGRCGEHSPGGAWHEPNRLSSAGGGNLFPAGSYLVVLKSTPNAKYPGYTP